MKDKEIKGVLEPLEERKFVDKLIDKIKHHKRFNKEEKGALGYIKEHLTRKLIKKWLDENFNGDEEKAVISLIEEEYEFWKEMRDEKEEKKA